MREKSHRFLSSTTSWLHDKLHWSELWWTHKHNDESQEGKRDAHFLSSWRLKVDKRRQTITILLPLFSSPTSISDHRRPVVQPILKSCTDFCWKLSSWWHWLLSQLQIWVDNNSKWVQIWGWDNNNNRWDELSQITHLNHRLFTLFFLLFHPEMFTMCSWTGIPLFSLQSRLKNSCDFSSRCYCYDIRVAQTGFSSRMKEHEMISFLFSRIRCPEIPFE